MYSKPNNNIVPKTPYTNVTSSDLTTATQGAVISYGYGDTNWSDKLTSYNGQTITYDDSGNPTSYKGDTITWNGRLMTSYTKGNRRYEYSYNSDGMRTVKKIYENNELIYTYLYIWDGDVLLASRISTADSEEPKNVRYLYDDSGELYGMDYKGVGFFGFIKNLQGDIVSIVPLDSQSDGEVNIEYDAWGKPIFEQTSSGSEALIMAMIIAATNVAYRSYFYDFDTELYYLRSRYYDPEVGRFINADDTAYLGADKSPLSFNLFAYCCNNPVFISDRNGYWSKSFTVTVNFYNLNTIHEHCDITYDSGVISYGTNNGDRTASMINKIIGTQGYILYKDSWRSYDPDTFTTIKVSVYYDLFYDFLVREVIKKSIYWREKKRFSVYIPCKNSKYEIYRLSSVTCATFASDLLYYSIDAKSKMRLRNQGKDLKKITLPSKLYEYLMPLK